MGSVPAATVRRFSAGWGLWRAGASTRRSCLRRLVHALQPPHPPRHPGLGPGSTGLRGGGKRLRPSPSPRSGPRNESGVTDLFRLGSGRHIASLQRRLGLVARWWPPRTGLLQASATRIAVAAPTPSPRTRSGVHRAARGRQEAPAIPLAAEWTPERVRGDGAFWARFRSPVCVVPAQVGA